MINQLTTDIWGRYGGWRLRLEIPLLVAARYTILALEAVVLSLLVAQILWLGRDLTFLGVAQIAVIAALCPSVVWAIIGEEQRLRESR